MRIEGTENYIISGLTVVKCESFSNHDHSKTIYIVAIRETAFWRFGETPAVSEAISILGRNTFPRVI